MEEESTGLKLRITPIREVFANPSTGFYVYGAIVPQKEEHLVNLNRYGNISIQADFPLKLDEEVEGIVELLDEGKYAGSYILKEIRHGLPPTPQAQAEYIKAVITPLQYQAIYSVYDNYKDMVATLIFNDEFDYSKVKGVGEVVIGRIKRKLKAELNINELLTFLHPFGVPYAAVKTIHSHYDDSSAKAIAKIKDSPYNLLRVKGFGFVKTDTLALKLGVKPNSEERIFHGMFHIIKEFVFSAGNTYTTQGFAVKKLASMLEITKAEINRVFTQNNLQKYNLEFLKDGKVTTTAMKHAEDFIAAKINQSPEAVPIVPDEMVAKFLEEYKAEGIVLSDEQEGFLYSTNKSQINFLVGGGGTGKTFLISVFCKMLQWYAGRVNKEINIQLTAPTGRASKILGSYVGAPAETLHKFCHIQKGSDDEDDGADGSFTKPDVTEALYGKLSSLSLIVVDESSMLDIPLVYKFLSLIDLSKTKIIFVGDDVQLPSVGAGNFLYDCLNTNSKQINVNRLNKTYRIKEGGVAKVTTAIREGEQFLSYADTGRMKFGKDLVITMEADKEAIISEVLTAYKNILSLGYTQDDIMVLSPKNVGVLGTFNLNNIIQDEVNQLDFGQPEMTIGTGETAIHFRKGDKVMNFVNAYDLPLTTETFDVTYVDRVVEGELSEEVVSEVSSADVFNGEVGTVISVNGDGSKIVVDFDGRKVLYGTTEAKKSLMLGYATTVHKSQGGQAPYVIAIFDGSDIYQLNANLIYTGITRTQKACFVLTQAKTMINSLKKFINIKRDTRLIELLG